MRLPRVRRAASGASSAHAGFTLAEAAVTIAIVALVLTMMLQGLEGAKFSAAHNRYRKTAYELGVGMLGEISAGIWREELDSGDQGYQGVDFCGQGLVDEPLALRRCQLVPLADGAEESANEVFEVGILVRQVVDHLQSSVQSFSVFLVLLG